MKIVTRILTTIILLSLLGEKVSSQVSTYTFSQSSGAYTAITGGTSIHTSGWDDAVVSVTIPFTFQFNGLNYTTVRVQSNGYVTFGTTLPSTINYIPISSTAGYAGAIAAFARDLVSNSSIVEYATEGSSPNRTFVIQWNNARRYSGGIITGDVLNFQIRLYETTNVAEVVYGTCTATNTTSYTCQVGLRGATNSDYNNRSTSSDWSSTTAGGSNSASCTSSNTIMPSSGLTFSWTPPAPPTCGTPTGLAASSITGTSANLTWVAPGVGTPATYDWEVRTSGAGGSGASGLTTSGSTTAPTVTASASGLSGVTAYNLYVRTNCSGGAGSSTWAGPQAFTTLFACPGNLGSGNITVASLPYSGTGLTNSGAGNEITSSNAITCGSSNYFGGEDKVFIFTPTITGSHTILLTTTSDDDAGIMLYDGCPFIGSGSTCVANTQSTTGLTRTISTSLTASTTYYLVVDNWPSPAFIASYSLSITPPVACPAPVSAAASSITSTTAQANWDLTTGSFIVEYGLTSTFGTPGTGATAGGTNTVVTATNTNLKVLSGLNNSTGYSYVVRQDCTGGGNGYSANSTVRTFTTLAPPPANDECANATDLTPTPGVFTNPGSQSSANATSSGVAIPTCDGFLSSSALDVWYKFTTDPTGGDATAVVVGSGGFDPVVQGLSGTCAAPVHVLCEDGTTTNGTETLVLTGLSASTTYFLRVYGWNGATGTFTISMSGTALPLELVAFTGKTESRSNMLLWETLTEKNVEWHIVERSVDGIKWVEVGKKAGQMESYSSVKYELEDRTPLAKAYYRLRSVDFDGAENLSSTIVLTRKGEHFGITAAFPSPTKNQVTLQFASLKEENVTIQVTDFAGRLVLVQEFAADNGINEAVLQLADLQTGVYLVRISNATSTAEPMRIVKE